MPTSRPDLTLFWCAPDGKEMAIGRGLVQLKVAEGVLIDVEPNVQAHVGLTVSLTLRTADPVRELSGNAGKRFVLIPVQEFAALVGVAEPSELPAYLCPVASAPAWIAPDGSSIPTADVSLTVRASDGMRLVLRLLSGAEVDNKSICVMQVTSASSDVRPGSSRSGLSILSLSPDKIRIAATPGLPSQNQDASQNEGP